MSHASQRRLHPVCVDYASSTALRPLTIRMAPLSGASCNATAPLTARRETAFTWDARRYLLTTTAGYNTGSTLTTSFTRDVRGVAELIYMPGTLGLYAVDPAYDAHLNLTSFTAPSGSAHSFTWTARDRLLSYTPPTVAVPGAEITATAYRAGGSLGSRSYRGSRSTTTTLDTSTAFVSAITRTDVVANDIGPIGRDPVGRPTSLTAAGGTLGLTWDGPVLTDEVSTVNLTAGTNARYRRDIHASGLLSSERACFGTTACTSTAGGRAILRTYDLDGFLVEARDDADGNAATTADQAGRVSYTNSFTPGAGFAQVVVALAGTPTLRSDVTITPLGELARNSTLGATDSLFEEEICNRDALGRVLRRGERIRTASTGTHYRWYEYTYEAHGYLQQARMWQGTWVTGTSSRCPTTFTGMVTSDTGVMTYNHRGNRTDGVYATAFNAEDQVTLSVRGYDGVGALSTRTDSLVARSFAYDLTGHLRSTTRSSITRTFDYDAAGRLVAMRPTAGNACSGLTPATTCLASECVWNTSTSACTSVSHEFVYRDGLNPVGWRRSTRAPVTCGVGGWDTAYFTYGASQHTPDLIVYDECSDGSVSLADVWRVLADERGSVRLVVRISNAAGTAADNTVIQRIDYDAWGAPSTIVGNLATQPFGFAGGIRLPDAALWHFGARDYDPTVGRWTAKDPISFDGGYNLYMYAGNDPVNFVDLRGANRTRAGIRVYEILGGTRNMGRLRSAGRATDAIVDVDGAADIIRSGGDVLAPDRRSAEAIGRALGARMMMEGPHHPGEYRHLHPADPVLRRSWGHVMWSGAVPGLADPCGSLNDEDLFEIVDPFGDLEDAFGAHLFGYQDWLNALDTAGIAAGGGSA